MKQKENALESKRESEGNGRAREEVVLVGTEDTVTVINRCLAELNESGHDCDGSESDGQEAEALVNSEAPSRPISH